MMHDKYTEKALRVIHFARYEAALVGSQIIESEHLLLGLIREGSNITLRLFNRFNIDVEDVKNQVEARIGFKKKSPHQTSPTLSLNAERVLNYALEEAEHLDHKYVGPEHILLGILRCEDSYASALLRAMGMSLARLRNEINKSQGEKQASRAKELQNLKEFCKDLNSYAERNLLDPVIGREKELERLIRILCRRTKNNPIIVGEPGVGKSALVEGLAQMIVNKQVPSLLRKKRILSLDIAAVVAGTKYRGQFEERLKLLINEAMDNPDVILFIDEMHTLVGAGSAEGSLDAANIMKPYLSKRELQCIGATTPAEYRKYIEKDKAFERRFQSLFLNAPSEEATIKILKGIKSRYEEFHNVYYTDEAIAEIVHLSSRYITERVHPDKAIDLMDEVGSFVKLSEEKLNEIPDDDLIITLDDYNSFKDKDKKPAIITKDHIRDVISYMTGVPLSNITEDDSQKLLNLEAELQKHIVSQRQAIKALCKAIRRSRLGLKNPLRPIGSFIFLGPTGVGKTEMARCLSRYLFGSDKALVRFDMSEFMEKHSVSKFIGSPPGYVGYEEGGLLTEKIRRNPYAVILFDEIEKAHPLVFNILLQILDDGHLMDSFGNRVDFKNTIIIMTSNLGAKHIEKKSKPGFRKIEDDNYEFIKEQVLAEVKNTFNPEFINRIDEIIVFHPLTENDLMQIIDLMMNQINDEIKDKEINIQLSNEAKKYIIDIACQDKKYGARPLRRALQKYVEDPIAELLLQENLNCGCNIIVQLQNDKLIYEIHNLASLSTG
jgi:ATP-dependent Clp protease ATP-binding subunit ClpC